VAQNAGRADSATDSTDFTEASPQERQRTQKIDAANSPSLRLLVFFAAIALVAALPLWEKSKW